MRSIISAIKDEFSALQTLVDKENWTTLPLPPPGRETVLCRRCLSLISYFITHWGDGTGYTRLRLIHSQFARPSTCPVCRKANMFFDYCLRADEARKRTPKHQWTWKWQVNPYNPSHYKDPPHLKDPSFYFPHKVCSIEMLAALGEYDTRIGFIALEPGIVDNVIVPLQLGYQPQAKPDLEQMRRWIFECMADHSSCRVSTEWYPDRLVCYDEERKCCRLVLKEELPQPYTPYVSFSHCWGRGERIVLTKDRLEPWRQELPVHLLGRSLRDAIQVTVDTGFFLVWIDSICIIQDSHEDWLAQAPMMNEVYKNAAYNIAALDAESDADGFTISQRDPYFEFGFSTIFADILGRQIGETRTGPTFEGTATQECVLLRQSSLTYGYDATLMPSADHCVLFKRGWVFQERNFARRTLAFLHSGVSWSCDQDTQSEYQGRNFVKTTMLHRYRKQIFDGKERMALCVLWSNMVQEYSKCQLTRETDRLIAIGALAKEVTGELGRYLAGLWEKDLWHQLAWRCSGWNFGAHATQIEARKHLGDDEYVAPSWTWASVRSPCKFRYRIHGDVQHGLVRMVDLEESGSEYAQVKSGWLRLFGVLYGIARIEPDRPGADGPNLKLIDHLTSTSLSFTSDTIEGYQLTHADWSRVWYMPHMSSDCLVLLRVDDGPTGYEQQAGEQLPVYRRIGQTTMTTPVWNHFLNQKALATQGSAETGYHEFILI